ncbi:AraC family transcriptional regulator [Gordonia desulfuricans]|uniref:AraC family transcriptional regulator n=1 Tax=Gordonia desulfuricans TaxID=89051 RepID=UPI00192EE7C2|nr:helix-turn-helix domain-containing protein [Gordonia desulfuricans]
MRIELRKRPGNRGVTEWCHDWAVTSAPDRWLSTVVDTVWQPLWVIGADGAIEYANEAAGRALGISDHADLHGRSSHDTLHAFHLNGTPYPAEECPIVQAARGHRKASGTETFATAAGHRFTAQWRISALPGHQLRLLAFHPQRSAPPMPSSEAGALPSVAVLREQVARSFRDPDLTPRRLAHDNHISLRTLQAILARAHASPAALIRRHRLDHARDLLRSGVPPRAAAVEAGFSEPDTFTRAFRREFGVTPATYARQVGSGR